MPRYHLYYLTDGILLGGHAIDAADDQEATRMAREHGRGKIVEIWNDHARVRVVTPAR